MTKSETRRSALSTLLFGAAATQLANSAKSQSAPDAAPTPIAPAAQAPGACTLFPQAVEGPFYFDPKSVTSDLQTGQPGAPMTLDLRVIESGVCTPITNARVDVWHADARGVYSGYDGQGGDGSISAVGQSYLRGTQFTDAEGRVQFKTVYPGWYPGRTPHIHVKVFLDDTTLATGQVYFPDELSQSIYSSREPYTERPKADTTNARDFLFSDGDREGGGTVMAVAQSADTLLASLVIAVDRSGKQALDGGGMDGVFRRMIGR